MSWVDAEWIFINKHSLWTQCVAQFHGFRLSFCARADPLDETDDLKVLIKVSSGAFCWLCKVFPMCPGSGEFSPWNPLPQGIAPCLRGDAPGYCLFPNWRYLLLPRTLLSYFELTCQYIMARVRNSLCWKGGAGGSARNKISNWWEDNIFSMSVSWKGSVRSLNIGSPSRYEYRVGIWYHKGFPYESSYSNGTPTHLADLYFVHRTFKYLSHSLLGASISCCSELTRRQDMKYQWWGEDITIYVLARETRTAIVQITLSNFD